MPVKRDAASTGRTALVGVLTALGVVILYLAALAPSGRQGLTAVSGLMTAAAVISSGFSSGAFCYITTGLLGLILSPDKGLAALYLLFFGIYPLVKYLVERLRNQPLEWVLKLVFFNLALSVSYFFFRQSLLGSLSVEGPILWVFYLVANLVFVVYDLGLSRLIALYVARIDKNLRRH